MSILSVLTSMQTSERDTLESARRRYAAVLLDGLAATLREADDVLRALLPSELLERRQIQGRDTMVMEAVYHVVEHFAMHTGQILWLAKARAGEDLGFYETTDDGRARLRWAPTPSGPQPRS